MNDDSQDEMPPEMKEHMMAALAHKAGLGPHPGMYKEASAKKMRAAQTGGSGELGPTEMDQAAVKQRGAIQQQATAASDQEAAQAQIKQQPVVPPSAPPGPQGETVPYTAQKGAVGGPGKAPQPTPSQAPPAAPGGPPPEEAEEQGPPQ